MNVVLVVVDTLRRDVLSPYGADNETPHLERIAERSTVFEDMTAASCWTMPTHGSMFTGLYPHRHRAVEPRVRLDPSVRMVSELLTESGFRTHAVNIPNLLSGEESGFQRGWTEWHNTMRDPKHVQARNFARAYLDIGLRERTRHAFGPRFLRALRTNWRTRYSVDKVADLTASPGDSFVFTNLYAAHREYDPLPPDAPEVSEDARKLATREDHYMFRYNYGDLHEELPESVLAENRALYEAEVRWIDANLGRLFDTLERRGALEDTVVMITGDHGELFGETDETPWVDHRNSLHPVLLDVPFLLYAPGEPAGRDDRLASHVDVAPTILEAAGVAEEHADAIDAMDGYSLFGEDRHEQVLIEHGPQYPSEPDIEARYDLDFSPYHVTRRAVRTKEYTVRFRDDGSVVAHNRVEPDEPVPEAVIEEFRDIVDDVIGWDAEEETADTGAVRDRLREMGYIG
jgi:arylsulfatase A-like enzyme